jgi:hypothetical protein
MKLEENWGVQLGQASCMVMQHHNDPCNLYEQRYQIKPDIEQFMIHNSGGNHILVFEYRKP